MRGLLSGATLPPIKGAEFVPAAHSGTFRFQSLADGRQRMIVETFGDDHPWKDYKGADFSVADLTAEEAKALESAVKETNAQEEARERAAADARAKKIQDFENWINGLPEVIKLEGTYRVNKEYQWIEDEYWNPILHFEIRMTGWSGEKVKEELEKVLMEGFEE